jgi:hypothetical protein
MLVGVGMSAVLLFVGLRVVERRRQLDKAAQARYAASLALYQSIERLFRGGEITVMQVYQCSLKVVEAQREMGDSAWAVDHLKRMRAVQKVIAGTPGNVCPTHETYQTVDYMIKEAEYWVLRETW